MVQNHCVAKSINDAGWYQLMQFTKYKAEYAGKFVEFVNPAGTSQTCICGFSVLKRPVSEDTYLSFLWSCNGKRSSIRNTNENRPSISTVGTTGINARQGLLNRGSMQREATLLVGW